MRNKIAAELASIRRLLTWMAILFTGVILYFAKDIIMPVFLGVLITLTLTPVVRLLQSFKIPAPAGALLVVLCMSTLLSVGVTTLSTPVGELFNSLPRIGERLSQQLRPYQKTISDISQAGDTVQEITGSNEKNKTDRVVVEGPGFVSSAASALATGVTSLFIALILSVFMLGSGTLFYEKLVASLPVLSDKKKALRIVWDVELSVSRYLLTITVINGCLGLMVGLALHLYGMPNAVLWGVIAATLNFLPFLGAVLGAILLAAVSFGIFDTLGAALIPPLIYYGFSAIEGNLITPYIVGRRLRLNTVAVFLTVAFWGWLWGLAGALMAVPMLVFISVLCTHINSMKTLGHFLSGQPVVQKESA